MIKFNGDLGGPRGVHWTHGDLANPSLWPWWKLFYVNIIPFRPTKGYTSFGPKFRLWIYTRHHAWDWDFFTWNTWREWKKCGQ